MKNLSCVIGIMVLLAVSVSPARSDIISAFYVDGTEDVDLTAEGTADWAVWGLGDQSLPITGTPLVATHVKEAVLGGGGLTKRLFHSTKSRF